MAKEIFGVLASTDSIPASTGGTGTFSSSGTTVTGTGTSFTTELSKGDWLLSSTAKEVRRIKRINSDTSLELESAYSSSASGDDVDYILDDDTRIIQLSIAADQGGASEVNGVALASGSSLNWSTVGNGGDVGVRFVEPKYVDTSTTGVSYLYTKF